MMTPKEKAQELVVKFSRLPQEGTLMWHVSFEIAKKCASIAVDEIIRHTYIGKAKSKNDDNSFEYWQEVKQEIEKL